MTKFFLDWVSGMFRCEIKGLMEMSYVTSEVLRRSQSRRIVSRSSSSNRGLDNVTIVEESQCNVLFQILFEQVNRYKSLLLYFLLLVEYCFSLDYVKEQYVLYFFGSSMSMFVDGLKALKIKNFI
jgi:hypothetical protein